jgi:hypothetical protein
MMARALSPLLRGAPCASFSIHLERERTTLLLEHSIRRRDYRCLLTVCKLTAGRPIDQVPIHTTRHLRSVFCKRRGGCLAFWNPPPWCA